MSKPHPLDVLIWNDATWLPAFRLLLDEVQADLDAEDAAKAREEAIAAAEDPSPYDFFNQ